MSVHVQYHTQLSMSPFVYVLVRAEAWLPIIITPSTVNTQGGQYGYIRKNTFVLGRPRVL